MQREPARIDLKELRKRAGLALPIGFADDRDENVPEETRVLSAQVQPIYRAVHWATFEIARAFPE
jgi:hypothetical protein